MKLNKKLAIIILGLLVAGLGMFYLYNYTTLFWQNYNSKETGLELPIMESQKVINLKYPKEFTLNKTPGYIEISNYSGTQASTSNIREIIPITNYKLDFHSTIYWVPINDPTLYHNPSNPYSPSAKTIKLGNNTYQYYDVYKSENRYFLREYFLKVPESDIPNSEVEKMAVYIVFSLISTEENGTKDNRYAVVKSDSKFLTHQEAIDITEKMLSTIKFNE